MVLGVAVLVRFFVSDKLPVAAAGAVPPASLLCIAAYSFLRDQELEAYTGKSLYLRAALCGLAYALLWAAYYPLPLYGIITGEPWQWVFVGRCLSRWPRARPGLALTWTLAARRCITAFT